MSAYSIITGILWCTVFSQLISRLRKNVEYLKSLYLISVLFLIGMTVLRVFFSFDFVQSTVITSELVLPKLISAVTYSFFEIGIVPVSLASVLLLIWIVGIIRRAIPLMKEAHETNLYYHAMNTKISPQVHSVIQALEEFPKRVKVVQSSSASSPVVVGLWNPLICIPDLDLSDKQWELILKHELSHLKRCDIITKIIVQAFSLLFWWNRPIRQLAQDIDDVLEIRCDRTALKNEPTEVADLYAKTIRIVASQEKRRSTPVNVLAFVTNNNEETLWQREEIIRSHGVKKQSALMSLGVFGLGIALFILSYSFIIQSAYTPVIENENVFSIDQQNITYVELPDGSYELYIDDVFFAILDNIDILKSGPQIIEDRNDLP